ncbi:hemolysin family protein [Flavobacteriaceae bacterium]|jgi:putative hemolysin|nr:hemolysin family protein [Flavobacteriaceae bacterium]MDA9284784.1 hemolysin family protein [Flavobacteriaceae bacterium]MDA9631629.1 hemolysin family protein [Bacteroidota bacterium]MDC1310097.1 hemolysin family protein [Flavobacteriaceae bacterium]MDC1320953.1 hemolysin family protein [Flavobacteriaceae bacterium]|tara:strand:+ start:3559 stop:4842 length:1284 start_codon:yes stop_codon:yes gene_type:complete
MYIDYFIVIVSLLFSAFFEGMEIAYVSSNKISIEIEKKNNNISSKILSKLTSNPSKFIVSMLIGTNLALVVYGYFMGDILMDIFKQLSKFNFPILEVLLNDFNLLLQTIISTIIILMTAQFLPKVFFQIYSFKFLKFFSIPAYFFYLCFYYISDFVLWITNLILKFFFKTQGDKVQLSISKDDLGNYIDEQIDASSEDQPIDSEVQIFQNALDFSDSKARDIMVPRIELYSLEIHDYISKLREIFVSTGFTKILIYKNTIDDIIGYVHSHDLFKNPKTIKSMLLPVEFVPESILIKDLLSVLTKKRKSIAIVLDEYGGTSGMITVEDIVEELFGEIDDEFDISDLIEIKLETGHYNFSARLEVDYLNEQYNLDLPESEDYGTLGGLIVNHNQEIPKLNEEVVINNCLFKIIDVSETKINTVSLTIKK